MTYEKWMKRIRLMNNMFVVLAVITGLGASTIGVLTGAGLFPTVVLSASLGLGIAEIKVKVENRMVDRAYRELKGE